MKSSPSSTSNLDWTSPLESLYKKPTKSCIGLIEAGIKNLEDLLWVLPLRIYKLPTTKPFSDIQDGKLFRGKGKIISINSRPNFRAKGRGGIPLKNITVVIEDLLSSLTLTVKWFNVYPSVQKKLERLDSISFLGTIQTYQGTHQIINPEYGELLHDSKSPEEQTSLKVKYPTINGVKPFQMKKIIDKIPSYLWDNIQDFLPSTIREKREFPLLSDAFKTVHGKLPVANWSEELFQQAKSRLIYEEFLTEQIKVYLRREFFQSPPSKKINISSNNDITTLLPFSLTRDQQKALDEIKSDLIGKRPMMRLLQGDVGCGKTIVAVLACLYVIKDNKQACLMCPTESLAYQHYQTIKELLKDEDINIELLIGSGSEKSKRYIQDRLKNGEVKLVIGTHSLIQNSVCFQDLGIAVIDEQHKFGVDQRIKLTKNNPGCHCLIMTATPIPRSLSLTQYGDLRFSTIKEFPNGKKNIKTRIVTPETFQNFLSFLKTRISLGEQAYVVVPAIEESEKLDITNLNKVLQSFHKWFPDTVIEGLHGKLKADQKAQIFDSFTSGKIQVLISTSVIEVGINVPNASIMAIMNPERFGLSSLHQLRGRVGRGDKPGFCFLVNDKRLPPESMGRLEVIEKHLDGFKIAEEDLKLRGEGELFGKSQSGNAYLSRKIANIVLHGELLDKARHDLDTLLEANWPPIQELLDKFKKDERIFSTI